MLEWNINENGNHVYTISKGDVMTVFKRIDGQWSGIYDGKFLRGSYDTPQEATKLMERWIIDGDSSLAAPPQRSWQQSKSGGFYKNTINGTASVKQAKSGKWYISIGGELIKNVWLNSHKEAIQKADEYLEHL